MNEETPKTRKAEFRAEVAVIRCCSDVCFDLSLL